MRQKLKNVLLVDDDEGTNFIHKLVITESDCAENIVIKENGVEALNYLKSAINGKYPEPDLIFLDVNMPRMNGWEFLEEFKTLPKHQKAKTVIVMLSTSLHPDDRERANNFPEISTFLPKPLSVEKVIEVYTRFF